MIYLVEKPEGSWRFGKLSLSPSDLPELRTLHNHIDGNRKAVVLVFELLVHLGQQRLVRELYLPAQSIAQQFAAKLVQDRIATLVNKIISQALQTFDFASVGKLRSSVDGAAGHVSVTTTSDGVKTLQCKTERVDPLVT